MSIVYKIAGVTLTDRVRLMAEGDGFTTAAYRGEVGTSGVTIHDESGNLTITGWQTFTVDDDEAFPDNRVFTGYIVERGVGRGDSEITGTARTFDCDVVDLNTLLNTAIFRTNAAKRAAESDLTRVAWMLTSEAMTGNVFDHGLIAASPAYNFLASDLRGRYPNDAMMEMAPSAVRNFFVYRDTTTGDASLFYDKDSAAVYSSSLRISNVASDIDGDGSQPGGTTFGPDQDATLSVEPNDVYCGVWYLWQGDPIYVHSDTIHAAFFGTVPTHRDAVYDNPRVGVLATAQQAAKDWLNVRAGEEKRITVTLYVPSGRVNWVHAGQRIEVKFSHLPGLTSFTWARVRRRTVKPAGPRTWEMRLELWIPPTPVDDADVPDCAVSIVQTKANVIGISFIIFDAPTVAGKTIFLYEAKRDEVCNAGDAPLTTWLPLSADVSTNGAANGDHGRWWYYQADGTDTFEIGTSDGFAYETDIDYATFNPADVVLYESDNAGTSATLGLGAVTSPTAGQLILYGATYDTAFTGSWPATPGSGWTSDHNANANAANPPTGTSDQHPHWLVMRWDGTTTPLTGSASIGLAQPYAGVMIQYGEDCDASPLPQTGAPIVSETPAVQPDGTLDTFTSTNAYVAGSLHVYLDGIRLLAGDVTEDDPSTGDYSLSFVPEADETLELDYTAA